MVRYTRVFAPYGDGERTVYCLLSTEKNFHQQCLTVYCLLFTENTPQLPLGNNYWQPEIRWVHIILCAFCQKNFFFAIKLHKKKIIVVGEIDSFTCLSWDYLLGMARVSTFAAQKSTE
ncbi:hypothetical protein [Microcystis sp. 0824]|uniref:hypothetical protein n=1 Tax=Microcystis sp. 0824 TaxID=1502726 RepID=UPI001E399A62|nr:hypothetical protein [Microcystis sp. 0824]